MSPAGSVQEYLASLPEEARSALEQMRAAIREALPDAAEVISYGVPTFKGKGFTVHYGAAKGHCALYGATDQLVESFRSELAAYELSKGAIRFPLNQPLPVDLITRLVRARVAAGPPGKQK